jgi:hypothetical protein
MDSEAVAPLSFNQTPHYDRIPRAMKITHSLAPAAQQRSPTMQDMKQGQIAIITAGIYRGTYILRTHGSSGQIFVLLSDGDTFGHYAKHPVEILPPGTTITLVTE